MKTTTTQWEKIPVSEGLYKFLRGTYHVWARLFDNEHVFTIRMIGERPGRDDGGYGSIHAAMKVKGLL